MVGPGGDGLLPAELDAALAYIAERPEVFETILTGGDPMLLSPRRLAALVGRLAAIPHLGPIRRHQRVQHGHTARVNDAHTPRPRTGDTGVGERGSASGRGRVRATETT